MALLVAAIGSVAIIIIASKPRAELTEHSASNRELSEHKARSRALVVNPRDLDEQEIDLTWDDRSASERQEYLRRELELELSRAETADSAAAQERAARLLSALRPELFGTQDGKTEYERLERRLEAITDANP